MNNLKLRICEWLHCAWKQVQGMEEIIVKGWGKTRITKTFKNEFQFVAMKANATLPYLMSHKTLNNIMK
jgi:hypothetical protein